MKVEIQNLRRHFGATRAVNDISFSFESGQVFGFIGPNGAGKTTTMRILATLDEPTSGQICINGTNVVENPEIARRLVGYMPDALPTHRDLSVHEYLDFFARAYGIRSPQRNKVVESVEQFTNLTGIRDKMLHVLSKGMKQRVSLARAIVHDPPLLVLDEPAAGLDPRARVELRELLKVLGEQGKAILISSHILTELAEITDGAVIIEHGQIVAAGTMEELLHGTTDAAGGTTPQIKLIIRALGPVELLHKALLQMPLVEEARISGKQVEAEFLGNEDMASELLVELLHGGFRIVEFAHRRVRLEEIFMSVTRGEVS